MNDPDPIWPLTYGPHGKTNKLPKINTHEWCGPNPQTLVNITFGWPPDPIWPLTYAWNPAMASIMYIRQHSVVILHHKCLQCVTFPLLNAILTSLWPAKMERVIVRSPFWCRFLPCPLPSIYRKPHPNLSTRPWDILVTDGRTDGRRSQSFP